MREQPSSSGVYPDRCFHCGDAIAGDARWHAEIDGAQRAMCCAGCKAVAELIAGSGLEQFYAVRSALPESGPQRVPRALEQAAQLADPVVEQRLSRALDDTTREAHLILTDLDCAACAWLIERRLADSSGVKSAAVNYATHRLVLRYDPAVARLGDLITGIARLGYSATAFDPARQHHAHTLERRRRLRGLGIAALFGMQIMMIAVALYAGDGWGMQPRFEQFFRWVSLLLTIPVIGYAATPFFRAAYKGVMNGAPGMDLPVALGIGIAFVASTANTLTGEGHIYFDSVAMFTFALLLARYLEFIARQRGEQRTEALVAPLPEFAHRLDDDGEQHTVVAAELRAGDRLSVRPGEAVPADGTLDSPHATVDASLLTGESRPEALRSGDRITGGAINRGDALVLRVSHCGCDTVVSGIMALVERARAARPPLEQLADRVATYFVVAVVAIAALVAATWYVLSPGGWIAPTISVLVVTCPCALSLATPTALTAAANLLTGAGALPVRGLPLETLASVDHVVFDKTGTLTTGRLAIDEIITRETDERAQCVRVATALERQSNHPIAAALRARHAGPLPLPSQLESAHGQGITGVVEGQRWWFGSPSWVGAMSGQRMQHTIEALERDGASVVMLASNSGVTATFKLSDELRPNAREVVDWLEREGVKVSLLSGDRAAAARRVAEALGIEHWRAALLPSDKLTHIRALQCAGDTVAAVGDGTNDAPVLAGASVSIAMGGGARSAQASADFIALKDDLQCIIDAVSIARRTRSTIRRNIAWAIGYNVVALPLAAAGLIPPWLAALGMSLSSLLVLASSLTLYRFRPSAA